MRNNKAKEKTILPKKSKLTMSVYFILRLLVVICIVRQIMNGNWDNVFVCILTLILFMVPSILERKMKIELPGLLEIVIILFIFAAEILGELQEYYVLFPRWDDMLHTTNGFLAAGVGFALIDILNKSDKIKFEMSPIFVAVVAFCFSMTVGVIWEFFEFSMDYWFGKDMQKDTWIDTFQSVAINPEGANVPIKVDVDEVIVNGEKWPGYLDIGLLDTMHDLFVNFIGAVVFSILGMVYIKNRGRGIAGQFIPKSLKKN